MTATEISVETVVQASGEFNAVASDIKTGVGLPPSISGALGQSESTSHPWSYWRKADGWVTIGNTTPVEYLRQLRKGMVALDQEYGTFFLNVKDGEYVPTRKYDLLLRRGGAREFPVDQLIELGWTQNPPTITDARGRAVKVSFPQLDGVATYTAKCPACLRTFVAGTDERVRHLIRSHESVMHAATANNSELGRILSTATSGTTESVSATFAQVLTGFGSALEAMAARQAAMEERFLAVMERLTQPGEDSVTGAVAQTLARPRANGRAKGRRPRSSAALPQEEGREGTP